MHAFFARLTVWRPQFLSLLRIVTALLYLEHATLKVFNFPAFPPRPGAPPGGGMPSYFFWIGIFELIGSLLLIVGWQTRLVAFLLSGEMAIAYWTQHFPHNFFPLLSGGEAAILFCFVYLYIAAAGPGPWSLDAVQKSPMA